MELIDKDVAFDKINKAYGEGNIINLKQIINKIPTIDAVPVVRCKDCKYAREPQRNCREEADACEGILVCWNGTDTVFAGEIGWRFVNDDFFCGDGKRKDGDRDE